MLVSNATDICFLSAGNADKQQIKQNYSPDAGTQQGDSSNPAGAAERQHKQEDPPGTAIQQTMPSYPLHAAKSQAKASSPAHKARGKLTSAGFVQSTKSAALQPGKGRQDFSAPKILKAPVQDASPDKEENAKAEESGSEDGMLLPPPASPCPALSFHVLVNVRCWFHVSVS